MEGTVTGSVAGAAGALFGAERSPSIASGSTGRICAATGAAVIAKADAMLMTVGQREVLRTIVLASVPRQSVGDLFREACLHPLWLTESYPRRRNDAATRRIENAAGRVGTMAIYFSRQVTR